MSPNNYFPLHLPNGTILLSDGGIDYAGNGNWIDYPNGTRVSLNGYIEYPNGTYQNPYGRVKYRNGTCRDPVGTYFDY